MKLLKKRLADTEACFRQAHGFYTGEEAGEMAHDVFRCLMRAIQRLPVSDEQSLALRGQIQAYFVEELHLAAFRKPALWRRPFTAP